MTRRLLVVALALALALPGGAAAKVDLARCAGASGTSVIAGLVENAKGEPLPSMTVEIQRSGTYSPHQAPVATDAAGRYVICARGSNDAAGHDFYDVRVSDQSTARLYATASQPYATYTGFHDADFVPENGLALLYQTSLTVTPDAIATRPGVRTPTGDVPVTFLVRSKAPSTTAMKILLGHRTNPSDPDGEFPMTFATTERGGPSAGGWNVWSLVETFPASTSAGSTDDRLYWAQVRGLEIVSGEEVVTTQIDRRPYVVDNSAPAFGRQEASFCGPGVTVNAFSPGDPGTTNPQPIVRHGVCDFYANGARSGLDPFSLRGWLCPAEAAPLSSCTAIEPVLDTFTVTWWPSTPLALGDYWLRWRIADYAGNMTSNDPGSKLTITDHGGQTPRLHDLRPGNLGNGGNLGVVLGVSQATPAAIPTIGFKVTDADGQNDLVIGSLRVRVYYPDERTLIYEYDPLATSYNPTTRKGPGLFDLSSGGFTAGYSLKGAPPGHYYAEASVNDRGGNAITVTWHWLLVGAV